MNYCLAFGCGTEVSLEGPDGQRINGITCLCWNYPCAGFEMLGPSQKHSPPGSATAAKSSRASFWPCWPCRASRPIIRFASARPSARWPTWSRPKNSVAAPGSDLSLALIGLAYYVDEPEWKNDLGETWSIDRIIEEELAQPVVSAPEGGLNRLLGLSYAVAHQAKHGAADRRAVRAGREVRGRLPRLRPAAAELRRQLGAVFSGGQGHQPRRGRAVAIDRPRAGVVGDLAARPTTGRRPDRECRGVRDSRAGQPTLPWQRAVAFHAGNRRGWAMRCTPWRFTTSGCSSPWMPWKSRPTRNKRPRPPGRPGRRRHVSTALFG